MVMKEYSDLESKMHSNELEWVIWKKQWITEKNIYLNKIKQLEFKIKEKKHDEMWFPAQRKDVRPEVNMKFLAFGSQILTLKWNGSRKDTVSKLMLIFLFFLLRLALWTNWH